MVKRNFKCKSDTGKLLHLNAVFVKSSHDNGDDEKDLIIEGFANTTDKDRAGDIIIQDAWKTPSALPNYLKNPIILAFHDHSKPIGVMVDHEVTSKGFRIQAKISKAAGGVYDLIKDGILQAFSVGFRVLDADYDSTTDIFIIKDLELHEISVVSVPCNQESVFQVSKSFDSDDEFANFKSLYTKQTDSETEAAKKKALEDELNENHNEEFSMDPQEIADLITKGVAEATALAETNRIATEKAKKDADDKKAAEDTRISAIVKSNTEHLVADLDAKMKISAEAFAAELAKVKDDVIAKSDEITTLLTARNNKMNYSDKSHSGEFVKGDLEEAFLLARICNKGIFETKMGQDMVKAVNSSSDITVSSDKYEQEVTTNLYRDMQEMLTVQPLFREIKMSSATQVLPINPNATSADWVAAAAYGSDQSTEPFLTKALTEIVLQTFKLAGKSYITDETEEDAIIPLLPLLRQQLVEAHANEIDNNFLNGTAATTASPTGLIERATAVAANARTNVTTAKADGTVKVTAKMLLQTRRLMGQWGLDLRKLNIIVSLDAYWDLLEDDEFSNLNEVGALATKKTGQVGAIYGIPVMVSTQMPAKAVTNVFAVIVNSDNFLVPRLRGFNIQSDYDVEKQRRVIVSTQRLGFADIIAEQGVVVAEYAA